MVMTTLHLDLMHFENRILLLMACINIIIKIESYDKIKFKVLKIPQRQSGGVLRVSIIIVILQLKINHQYINANSNKQTKTTKIISNTKEEFRSTANGP